MVKMTVLNQPEKYKKYFSGYSRVVDAIMLEMRMRLSVLLHAHILTQKHLRRQHESHYHGEKICQACMVMSGEHRVSACVIRKTKHTYSLSEHWQSVEPAYIVETAGLIVSVNTQGDEYVSGWLYFGIETNLKALTTNKLFSQLLPKKHTLNTHWPFVTRPILGTSH